ncbi:MAG: hypothetical protein HY215_06245 [Candidatus Rokubacteria bacterium]|nr:hypothetical protein [Candidatus Rokubacteria bacterium]
METLSVSLCPACDACPQVEISGDGVRIGEAGNVLVELVRSGQLTQL